MAALRALPLRSVLLTSGTLSPLESFAHELQLGFKYTLENPHVINPSQVGVESCVTTVVRGGESCMHISPPHVTFFVKFGRAASHESCWSVCSATQLLSTACWLCTLGGAAGSYA